MSRRRTSILALTTILAVAMALAACGGDESGDPTAHRDAAGAEAELGAQDEAVRRDLEERRRAEAPSEEEIEAKRVATRFYDVLGADRAAKSKSRTTIDSESFCDLMSEQAVAQTVHYAKVTSGIRRQWDCESAVDLLVLRSKRAGGFKGVQAARVIGVNAEGDRATATVRFGGGAATSIALAKEGDEWKLAASPVASAYSEAQTNRGERP